MGSGLIWILKIFNSVIRGTILKILDFLIRGTILKILISLIREVILKIIKLCTVSTNILRGDENFEFHY